MSERRKRTIFIDNKVQDATLSKVLEYVQDLIKEHGAEAVLEIYASDGCVELNIERDENDEEMTKRIANETHAEKQWRDRRRAEYEKLKKEFEGETK